MCSAALTPVQRRSVLSRNTELECTRRRLSSCIAPAGIALILEALAGIAGESGSTGRQLRHGQFIVVDLSLRFCRRLFKEAELQRASSHSIIRTEAIVAAIRVLEGCSRFALLLHRFRGKTLCPETGFRTKLNCAYCFSRFDTGAVVTSIGMFVGRSRDTVLLWWSVSLCPGIETELHSARSDSRFRAEAIVTSVGAFEGRSRDTILLRWLHSCISLSFGIETELHCARSDAGVGTEAIIASICAFERRPRNAVLFWWLCSNGPLRLQGGEVDAGLLRTGSNAGFRTEATVAVIITPEGGSRFTFHFRLDSTPFPWWTSLTGAEPSDAVSSALAAVAVLHLHLIGGAHLPVGVHFLFLLFDSGSLRLCVTARLLNLRIVALQLRQAKLSRTGYNHAVGTAAARVTVHLECASRFTSLTGFEGQCSRDKHCRN